MELLHLLYLDKNPTAHQKEKEVCESILQMAWAVSSWDASSCQWLTMSFIIKTTIVQNAKSWPVSVHLVGNFHPLQYIFTKSF